LEDFRKEPNTTGGGVDFKGHQTTPAKAVGLTYETCKTRCGGNAESFNWREFAQLFSSWLLPWLALISQLPFGSGNYADDFVSGWFPSPFVIYCIINQNDPHARSVALSVGSPALAAYSLILTSLNARLIYRRTQRIKHDGKNAVARALISLQQTPLELTKDERLLAFIPINDQWRHEIVDRLNRRNAWSVATGSSVAWVFIAFTFTLVDSFVSLGGSVNSGARSDGLAVGTLWLWLLCLVIGWLWVPTFSCSELKSAIGHANKKAAKKAAKRIKQKSTKAYASAMNKITNRLPRRVPTLKVTKKPVDPVHEADEDNEKVKPGSIQEGAKLDPLSNITHYQSTVSCQTPIESQHGHGYYSVSGNPTANPSAVSLPRSGSMHSIATQSSIHPETNRLLIPMDDFGSLNQDELRLSATFNYSRIMRYLVLVDDVLSALGRLTCEKDEVGLSRKCLVLEVVSLILNRKSSPSLRFLPCLRGVLYSHLEHSSRCSTR